jgi:hypothetical protein
MYDFSLFSYAIKMLDIMNFYILLKLKMTDFNPYFI